MDTAAGVLWKLAGSSTLQMQTTETKGEIHALHLASSMPADVCRTAVKTLLLSKCEHTRTQRADQQMLYQLRIFKCSHCTRTTKGQPAHFQSHPQSSSGAALSGSCWPRKPLLCATGPVTHVQSSGPHLAAVRCSCGFVLSMRPQALSKVAATALHNLSLAVMKLSSQKTSDQAYQNTMRVRTSLCCAHCLKLAAFTWMPLSRSTPSASQIELYQRRFTGPSNSWSGDK